MATSESRPMRVHVRGRVGVKVGVRVGVRLWVNVTVRVSGESTRAGFMIKAMIKVRIRIRFQIRIRIRIRVSLPAGQRMPPGSHPALPAAASEPLVHADAKVPRDMVELLSWQELPEDATISIYVPYAPRWPTRSK